MSASHVIVELNHQPIELCKLLKIANLVSGGGEAKIVISEGYVYLNGEVEYQKRKKIYHDDMVEFNGDAIQVVINEDLEQAEQSAAPIVDNSKTTENIVNKTNAAKNPKKTKGKAQEFSPDDNIDIAPSSSPRKRRPISF